MILFIVFVNVFVLIPYLIVWVFVDIPIPECSSPKGGCLRMSPGWEISFLLSFSSVFLLEFFASFLLGVLPSAFALAFHELIHVACSPGNTS